MVTSRTAIALACALALLAVECTTSHWSAGMGGFAEKVLAMTAACRFPVKKGLESCISADATVPTGSPLATAPGLYAPVLTVLMVLPVGL